ncbi:MAG: DUF2306 domain-containing protein [Acidobacteriota bacterium]
MNILRKIGALLCIVIAVYSARYFLPGASGPEIILSNLFRAPWLLIHVGAAVVALMTGPVQFVRSLRQKWPAIHRWLGRLYVAGCIVGGLTGLILAFGASTGPISTAGFGLLAIAWMTATGLAWRTAMQRRFVEHRMWMIRSFALTCAAVTLRLYLQILPGLPIPFVSGYRAISFLCWVPNILVAEYFLRRAATRQAGRIA